MFVYMRACTPPPVRAPRMAASTYFRMVTQVTGVFSSISSRIIDVCVTIFYTAIRYFLATLIVCHGPHKYAHLILLRELDALVWFEPRFLADEVDVSLCVVLAPRCPSANQLRNCAQLVFGHVGAQDDESGTQTPLQRLELPEVGVGLLFTKTAPAVCRASNIQRVVVADAARLILLHAFC